MKNLVTALFVLFLLIGASSIHAQNDIKGTVVDKSNESKIAYATISLLKNASVIKGVITDGSGNFILENIFDGVYVLKISFLGYETREVEVTVPGRTDLGVIFLSVNEKRLSQVVVTAQRPLIVQRIDRMVVNVAENISTGGKNGLEVLSQTPGVLVIGSDVNAMGKPAVIYIDGRPTKLSGEQLANVLSSLQGDQISTIEVITNPSSRYDAAGSAVIDIKTKKGLQFGLNGSVDAGYRQSRKDRENVGLNLNYRREKINLYGNYGVNRTNIWQQVNQTNTMFVNGISYLYDQETLGESNKAKYGQNYKMGVDYFINKKHTIGALFNGSNSFDGYNMSLNGKTTITPAQNNIRYSTGESTNSSGFNAYQYNLNYQGLFSKPGQQLNIDLDYGIFSSDKGQYLTDKYYGTDSLLIGNTEQIQSHNPQEIKIASVKADFIRPVGKGKLELGAKYGQSNTDNDLTTEIYNGTIWVNDNKASNHFVYTEQIQAAYANYSQSFGKWDFQAGLREEYTSSKGDQKTTRQVNDTSYMNLFPTAYVNYRISELQTLNASYRKSIIRPNYGVLNPFETRLDAYTFERGNPYLQPMMMDNFSLTYNNRKLGLMTALSYDIRHNQITEVAVQDGDKYGLTKTNFGKYQQVSATINYYKSLTKWWTMNAMLMGQYGSSYNNSEEFGVTDDQLFSYMGQLYNKFTLNPTLSAELTGVYVSSQQQGFLIAKPMYSVNAGLRKSLLKNKLTVSLNVNDIFNAFRIKAKIKTDTQTYSLNMDRDNRYVSVSVKYIFGSDKVKGTRNRKTGVEDEMGRTGK